MSLFRQLWLAVIASTILAFAGSFVVSMLTARNYLENQLATKNADNASSLALSITQLPKDPVTIDLQVSALYDSGQYEAIRLTDPNGKVMIEKLNATTDKGAPGWFIGLLKIESHPGIAQISDGWTQFAQIELISHTRFAYQELWRGGVKLLAWFLVGGALVGFFGSLVLRNIRKPLDAVVAQAEALSDRKFNIIPVPRIPELKSVGEAMNNMVTRLKLMFEEEAGRLEQVRQEANLDKLTGLANRSYFVGQMETALVSDEFHPNGLALLLRIADLAAINRRFGREMTDDLLRRAGQLIADLAATDEQGAAGRLNGADYAILLPNASDPRAAAEKLLEDMRNLGAAGFMDASASANVGATIYHQGEILGNVLSRLDQALAAAESKGPWSWIESTTGAATKTTSQADWRKLITSAISGKQLKLVDFPTVRADGSLLHFECPIRLQAADGEWLAAGSFMPMANRLKLTDDLDLAAVSLALDKIRQGSGPLSVNISGESIIEESFTTRLHRLLSDAGEARFALWLEFPEVGVFQHFEAFRSFCQAIQPLGCKLGIEHFGHRFSSIGNLPGLGLDFLKVDGSFVRNIHIQAGNQAFLKGLCAIAHNIGLQVIAEGVQDAQELDMLVSLGFDGATGPGIQMPA